MGGYPKRDCPMGGFPVVFDLLGEVETLLSLLEPETGVSGVATIAWLADPVSGRPVCRLELSWDIQLCTVSLKTRERTRLVNNSILKSAKSILAELEGPMMTFSCSKTDCPMAGPSVSRNKHKSRTELCSLSERSYV